MFDSNWIHKSCLLDSNRIYCFFSFANLTDELDINQQKMMGLTNNNEEFGFSFTHTVWVYQGYTGCNRDIMLTYVYTSVLSMGTMV